MSFFADYHTHSSCSTDGHDSVPEMAAAAMNLGLDELCITEHCECNGFMTDEENNTHFVYDRDASFSALQEGRSFAGDRLRLPRAIEMGQAAQLPDIAKNVLEGENFDFIIGSLHNLHDHCDFAFIPYTSQAQCLSLLDQYLDELMDTVNNTDFDVIGHVDYPLRYMRPRSAWEVSFKPLEEKLRGLLRTLAGKGRGIEINTKNLRGSHPVDTDQAYLLRLYREEGGIIVTAGSDAHFSRDVGAGIRETYDLFRSCGFDHVASYTQRRAKLMKI